MRVTFVLALALLAGAAAAAPRASFDCTKAATPVEKLICSHEELAALDVQMAEVFGKLVADHKAEAADIRDGQRQWLAGRTHCITDFKGKGAADCLKSEYTGRLATIKNHEFVVCGKPKMTGANFSIVCTAPNNPLQLAIAVSGHKSDTDAQLTGLSVSKASGKPQLFKIDGQNFFDGLAGGIELIDVNFDGYDDIKLTTATSAGPNMGYDYWLYVPKTDRFTATKLGERLSGFEVMPDAKAKTIRVNGRASCCQWEAATYWWDRGALRVRMIEQTGAFTVSDIPGLEQIELEACGARTAHFDNAEALVAVDFTVDPKECDAPADGPSDPSKLLRAVQRQPQGYAVQIKDSNHFKIRFAKPLPGHTSL